MWSGERGARRPKTHAQIRARNTRRDVLQTVCEWAAGTTGDGRRGTGDGGQVTGDGTRAREIVLVLSDLRTEGTSGLMAESIAVQATLNAERLTLNFQSRRTCRNSGLNLSSVLCPLSCVPLK